MGPRCAAPDAQPRRRLRTALAALAVLAVGSLQGLEAQEAGTLLVANRPVVTFAASYDGHSPGSRAQGARERIDALPRRIGMPVSVGVLTINGAEARLVMVGGTLVFAILPGDVEPGDDLDGMANAAAGRLRQALDARAESRRWQVLAAGAARILLAAAVVTAVLLVLAAQVGRLRRWFAARAAVRLQRLHWLHPELRSRCLTFVDGVLALTFKLALGALLYGLLLFALLQVPYTQPWGARLGAQLAGAVAGLVDATVRALPGLLVAAVIVIAARAATHLSRLIFTVVGRGTTVGWLHPDTVGATQRLTTIGIWALAVVAAYPYIPGGNSDAFKGIGLMIGLVASLGSTGIAAQAMSGLTVVYSRALRVGDVVRVGDVEGVVASVDLLVTKVTTAAFEEVTIPNSLLVSEKVTNYSRMAGHSHVISIVIGIGYAAPWRQVHALLTLAASRTPGINATPAPRIRQRSLRTFDIEYVLVVAVQPGGDRAAVASNLNAAILDAFNEYGVQIMTPAFESQPEQPVYVPPSGWHRAPAHEVEQPAAPSRAR